MKTINSKYKLILFLGFLSLLVFSCEKQTIELVPGDRITDESAFDNAERCELAVIGVYAKAQSGEYPANGSTRGYPFGAASILQSDMRGEDMLNTAAFFQITYEAIFTAASSSANLDAMWQNSLTAVSAANLVIEGVNNAAEKGVISREAAEEYEGECRFLRALIYHNLLIHFARPFAEQGNNRYGLPYYTIPINTSTNIDLALNQGRNTLDECYEWILDDLDFAESALPAKRESSPISRAGKAAAIALKARVKLHKADWKGARDEAIKLVPASFVSPIGAYSLTADPYTPFESYSSNSESIFSIENSPARNSSVNGALDVMTSSSLLKGRAQVSVSPIIYNSPYWLEKDKRRQMLIYEEVDTLHKTGTYFSLKYSSNVSEMSSWAPIIRYAEVILTYAEAIVRSGGGISEALPYLNAVRNRSLIDPAADAYTVSDFQNSKEFLAAVLAERRIEFLAEGRRWEDIHRLFLDPDFSTGGIPVKVSFTNMFSLKTSSYLIGKPVPEGAFFGKTSSTTAPGTSFIPYKDARSIWPIPESTTTRNELLKSQQNEGWK